VSPALFATWLVTLRVRLSLKRRPLVTWVQDLYSLGLHETGEGGRVVSAITRWVESYALRRADRVVVVHPRFAEYVVGELGVQRSKVVVIRNWAHLPASGVPSATTSRSHLGWPKTSALAVHLGNMGAKQGLENIVEAARLADQVSAPILFILVGDGSERNRLQAGAKGISRIKFVDPLDEHDFRMALAAADVLVVNEKPGVSSMAVPSKLTSYFDAGKPIVAATDPHGTTADEINASGAGIVVPAGEPRVLLETALQLCVDRTRSSTYGSNGRAYREAALGEDRAISAFEGLLNRLLATRDRSDK